VYTPEVFHISLFISLLVSSLLSASAYLCFYHQIIVKKLKELLLKRGKRGTNREQVVADLRVLNTKPTSAIVMLKVLLKLMSSFAINVVDTCNVISKNPFF
jgi:hypothetical protein